VTQCSRGSGIRVRARGHPGARGRAPAVRAGARPVRGGPHREQSCGAGRPVRRPSRRVDRGARREARVRRSSCPARSSSAVASAATIPSSCVRATSRSFARARPRDARPGAFVGEVSALTGAARTATVRARTPVSTFRLRGEDVRPIVKKHRDLVARSRTMQSRHIRRAVRPSWPRRRRRASLLRDRHGARICVTRRARDQRTWRAHAADHAAPLRAYSGSAGWRLLDRDHVAGGGLVTRHASQRPAGPDPPGARPSSPPPPSRDADGASNLLHRLCG
jgi:hypothetical protein